MVFGLSNFNLLRWDSLSVSVNDDSIFRWGRDQVFHLGYIEFKISKQRCQMGSWIGSFEFRVMIWKWSELDQIYSHELNEITLRSEITQGCTFLTLNLTYWKC